MAGTAELDSQAPIDLWPVDLDAPIDLWPTVITGERV
jgi:hypothetical protein